MTPSLWAPAAHAVDLVTDDGRTSMTQADGGWWRSDAVLGHGDRYGFSILENGSPVSALNAEQSQDRFAQVLARAVASTS